MNRMIRELIKYNTEFTSKEIIKIFYDDNKFYMNGLSIEYITNNLDNKTRMMMQELDNMDNKK